MPDTLIVAYMRAEAACGRAVEVEETQDGSFVVVYLNAQERPPPKAATELEALEGFVAYMKSMQKEIEPDAYRD